MDIQSTRSILYYSIIFPDQYERILKIVQEKLFGNRTADYSGGLFVKQDDGFGPCFGSISEEDKKIICETYHNIISQFKRGEIFVLYNNTFYKINSHFHITILYVGGKEHEKSVEMESQMGREIQVPIDKFAISSEFIALRVGDLRCHYYGNSVKHITIGLAKSEKRLLPKDSPKAFTEGHVCDVNLNLSGVMHKVMK